MFLRFESQDDRREYGGSCFIELQFCKLPVEASIEQIMDGNEYWRDDSLYVYGDMPFYSTYKEVFGYGIHQDKSEGYLDNWGITYYRVEQIDEIIDWAKSIQPPEYEKLVEWLEEAKEYNGFYILGM